jgi:hypothetical protein
MRAQTFNGVSNGPPDPRRLIRQEQIVATVEATRSSIETAKAAYAVARGDAVARIVSPR